MRLIDRDKFINAMFDLYLDNKWSPKAVHFSLLDVRANIDTKAYEVKAIPIEWINEWHWNNSDVCCDKHVNDLFVKMIEDWVKENGKQD